LATPDDLGEEPPGQDPGAQVDAVGQTVVHAGQAGLHQLGENHRVDDDHRQRIEDRPRRTEQGIAVARLKLALDAAQHETAVTPYRASHAQRHQCTLPYWSSKRTISSSPRYSPLCT